MNPEVDYQVHKLRIKNALREGASASKWSRSFQSQGDAKSTATQSNTRTTMITVVKSVIVEFTQRLPSVKGKKHWNFANLGDK